MKINECNPYLRYARVQAAMAEGAVERKAYDHRLFYILEGQGSYSLAGAAGRAHPDLLIFVPPATGYNFRGALRAVVLNFDLTRAAVGRPPIFPSLTGQFFAERVLNAATAEGFEAPFTLSGDLLLRNAMLELTQIFLPENVPADAHASAALKILLAETARRRAPSGGADLHLAERVAAYIRAHAAEIGSNEALGRKFGYHPVYLGAVFCAATGKTLHQAILEERILQACRGLTQTDRSVEEIAVDTGFCSRNHFSTAFRKQMNCTPAAYRKKWTCVNKQKVI